MAVVLTLSELCDARSARSEPGNLFGCQTTLSVEIIFHLTLALSLMRFQFMSRQRPGRCRRGIINALS